MSFLLRTRGSNGNERGRSQLPSAGGAQRGGSGIASREARPSSIRAITQSKVGIQSGNQMLIQRQHPHKQATVRQAQRGTSRGQQIQVSEQQQQERHQEAQGVISMTEVLADLQVLEQQQREAQQKLASARMVKVQRLQQHTVLESKLEKLKYSNGEFRAQLRQSRELLSVGTRALGARKLEADKAGKDIRAFEKKLKQGLVAARLSAACCRKIDSLFIVVEKKHLVLHRLKTEAKAKLLTSKQTMQAEKRRETFLRSEIQGQVGRSQECSIQMVAVRTHGTEAEKDLLAAQNMEESTRGRFENVAAQIAQDNNHHQVFIAKLSADLNNCKTKAEECATQEQVADNHVDTKFQNLEQARSRAAKHLQELGIAACQPQSDGAETRYRQFGGQAVETVIRVKEGKARAIFDTNICLRNDLEDMRSKLQQNAGTCQAMQDSTTTLIASAQAYLSREEQRSKELLVFQQEIEQERGAAKKLAVSAKELREAWDMTSGQHKKQAIAYEKETEQARVDIEATKATIEKSSSGCKQSKADWESVERLEICGRLEQAKDSTKSSEASLSESQARLQDVEKKGESRMREKVDAIKEGAIEHSLEHDEQIHVLVQKCPWLQKISHSFVYDSSVAHNVQAEHSLKPLEAELESMIEAAEACHKKKSHDKTKARRRAERAAAQVHRKEEERRKNSVRIDAEIHRQELEELTEQHIASNLSALGTTERSRSNPSRIHTSEAPRERKGSAFYLPQSQEDALEDTDTPAQPKLLFPSFAKARDQTDMSSSIDMTQSSDKRVRWEDTNSTGAGSHAQGEIDNLESCRSPAVTRRSKQYGSSKTKRGLAAISHQKVHKRSPKVAKRGPSSHISPHTEEDQAGAHSRSSNEKEMNSSTDVALDHRNSNNEIHFESVVSKGSRTKTSRHEKAKYLRSPKLSAQLLYSSDTGTVQKVHNQARSPKGGNAKHDSKARVAERTLELLVEHSQDGVDKPDRSSYGSNQTLKKKRAHPLNANPILHKKRRRMQKPGLDPKVKDGSVPSSKKSPTNSSYSQTAASQAVHSGLPSVVARHSNSKDTSKRVRSSEAKIRTTSSHLVASPHSQISGLSRNPVKKLPPSSKSRSADSESSRISAHSKRSKDKGKLISANSNSRTSSSRSVASETSRTPGHPKKMIESTKFKTLRDDGAFSTQASGLPSCEGAPKARRRKKKEIVGSQRNKWSLADDSYSFAF